HREGRKIWSDMALVDADDGAAVISRATWIVVDPSYAAAPGPNTQNTRTTRNTQNTQNTRNWAG
ncbi:MAG: hypothetical protein GY745_03855, partial [Actinomycetia bacterium]|nr:hypothetical protein [Actinomycetes bacterium]